MPRAPDRGERGELTDRVADDDVGLDPLFPHGGQDREARRDERRLLHLRLDELVERPLEAEVREIHARGLRADAVDLHRLRHGLRDLAAHADLERALAREAERDLRHPPASDHSSNAEPHVSPAPMPVIRTSAPGRSLPSARASASASGIEPDDVLPNLSTFTTVRS